MPCGDALRQFEQNIVSYRGYNVSVATPCRTAIGKATGSFMPLGMRWRSS
jgi:hypothetical protein